MAESLGEKRGQFILDLDLTSGGNLFFLVFPLEKKQKTSLAVGEEGCSEVSGVNSACRPVFVSADPLKHCWSCGRRLQTASCARCFVCLGVSVCFTPRYFKKKK